MRTGKVTKGLLSLSLSLLKRPYAGAVNTTEVSRLSDVAVEQERSEVIIPRVGAVCSLKHPPMFADGEIIPFCDVHRGKDLISVGDVDDLPALGLC